MSASTGVSEVSSYPPIPNLPGIDYDRIRAYDTAQAERIRRSARDLFYSRKDDQR